MLESLTAYELIDIVVSIGGQLDSLFNYWISASFAVVVSSFIGKDHFNYAVTLSVSVLYFLASSMFAIRFIYTSSMIRYYVGLAGEVLPPNFDGASAILGLSRIPTFIVGFIVVQIYLWQSYKKTRSKIEIHDT